MRPGKPWVELPRLCNACPLQSIIYIKYRIHFPYFLIDTCFVSTPFAGQEKESCLPVREYRLYRKKGKINFFHIVSAEKEEGKTAKHISG